MKLLPAAAAVTLAASVHAQAAALPSFASEKISLPTLSLQEVIAANDAILEPRSRLPETLPQPRTFLDRAALTANPPTEEKSGPRMRVISPDSTVHYKMRIVTPSPHIDPKMIIDAGSDGSDNTK